MRLYVVISIMVVVVAIAVGLYFALKPSKDVTEGETSETSLSVSTNTSVIPEETVVTAEVVKPQASRLLLEYKGRAGTEHMVVSINGKIIHDTTVPKTAVTKTFDISADNYPVKTIVIDFKNDAADRDLYIIRALLDDVDIKSKFTHPSLMNDAARLAEMRQGSFKWYGKYTYNQ